MSPHRDGPQRIAGGLPGDEVFTQSGEARLPQVPDRAHAKLMSRHRIQGWARVFALALGLVTATGPAVARTLPYPAAWPVRLPLECGHVPGAYENRPRAVEDAGQHFSALTLAAVLQQTRGTDTSQPGRDTPAVVLSVTPENRIVATYGDPVVEAASPWRCKGRRARVTSDALRVPATLPPADPLAHLRRIGIRALQPTVFATPDGDLIVALRVTRRERGYDAFGYPAVDEYWLWYRRVADSQ